MSGMKRPEGGLHPCASSPCKPRAELRVCICRVSNSAQQEPYAQQPSADQWKVLNLKTWPSTRRWSPSCDAQAIGCRDAPLAWLSHLLASINLAHLLSKDVQWDEHVGGDKDVAWRHLRPDTFLLGRVWPRAGEASLHNEAVAWAVCCALRFLAMEA